MWPDNVRCFEELTLVSDGLTYPDGTVLHNVDDITCSHYLIILIFV